MYIDWLRVTATGHRFLQVQTRGRSYTALLRDWIWDSGLHPAPLRHPAHRKLCIGQTVILTWLFHYSTRYLWEAILRPTTDTGSGPVRVRIPNGDKQLVTREPGQLATHSNGTTSSR